MDIVRSAGPATVPSLVGFDLRRRPHLESDVLVVGSGIAGLSAALAAADNGCEVLLLCKNRLTVSNTAYAQGGIAAVLGDEARDEGDSIGAHLQDTLAAGGGLCDATVAEDMLSDGSNAIAFLQEHGCHFDPSATSDGLALTREGGHSFRRILHARGDATGREIADRLAAAVLDHHQITVVEDAFAIDLLRDGERVVGVIYHRREEFVAALAGSTVLATGGCGQVYRETTNPIIATGDGLAMAYRAGAELVDMEFMQFHPTTLYVAGGARYLITEAMRGEGAHLLNHQGERFMPRYHPDAELAPRDVVSQAILQEIGADRFPHVWLDATHLGRDFLSRRFPTIFQACQRFNIDISEDWIPVHPSAHYHCGGIRSDSHGATGIAQLYAAGEVTCTGLHGANRLASNSLLEGLVVGRRAGSAAAATGGPPGRIRLLRERFEPVSDCLDIGDLLGALRSLMWRDVGIARDAAELATAIRSLRFWSTHQLRGFFRHTLGWEMQNLLIVGQLIATAAANRPASVGTHLRRDSAGAIDPRHFAWYRPDEDPV